MIGIGVGIDYALFIVTRYREALARGLDPDRRGRRGAMATAGRAVFFAGCTVMISLLGMLLDAACEFLHGLAVGTSLAVLVAVVAAVTLLPALLGFAGGRIDRSADPPAASRAAGPRVRETVWHRWSRAAAAPPGPAAGLGLAALLVLAAPVLVLRLGAADAGNGPGRPTTRSAYDLLAEGFGPGFNGPLVVVVELPTAPTEAAARRPRRARCAATARRGLRVRRPGQRRRRRRRRRASSPRPSPAGPAAPRSWSATCATTSCPTPPGHRRRPSCIGGADRRRTSTSPTVIGRAPPVVHRRRARR